MGLPGWAIPTFAAAILGFGLIGSYSYFDYSYVDTSTRSASRPVVPILSPDDKESSPAQQPSEASTTAPGSLPEHTGHPSSQDMISSTDPWASEAMEAAARETVSVGPGELDRAVEGNDLRGSVSGERADSTKGSVPSQEESSSLGSTSPESTTADHEDPALDQKSAGSDTDNTDAPPQVASPSTQPSDPAASMQTPSPPSPPPADASLPQRRDTVAGGANTKPKRVLMVEDPRVLGESLATKLKSEPGLVVVSQTGPQVECANFASTEGGLDAAIVELSLPDDQGTSLIEGLRRSCPRVPLLVLTTSLDPADQERVVKAGADAVLTKDADPEEIASTVRLLSPS